MRVDVWTCDKCKVEFREGIVHYEELDFCPVCAEDLALKRKGFDDELDALRSLKPPKGKKK